MTSSQHSAHYQMHWRSIAYWTFAILATITAFFIMRQITMCWQLTSLPGIPPSICKVKMEDTSFMDEGIVQRNGIDTMIPASPESQLPVWDGSSRVNIVFFGLRSQDLSSPDCPLCTDTIIVFTLDPPTKTAGMLSIPRDLWVQIPRYGYGRINTAWTIGEADKLPGGGAQLALETISQLLGVPLHYYVQVDFGTFVSFINLIGGINVYVEERMVLDPTGPGEDHFVLKGGDYRHLNGKRALAYARCRDEAKGCRGGDFGRAARQQQVIMAIRDKVFDPNYFPTLLTQAPQIYENFNAGIQTNLSFEDALKLATLVQQIPTEKIQQRVIDASMAIPTNTSIHGISANVLRPIPDLIRIVRDEVFHFGGALSPLAQGNPLTLLQSEQARIRLVNYTQSAGLEKRLSSYLSSLGIEVTEYAIPTGFASHTRIIVYSEKLYTLRFLKETFGVASQFIHIHPAADEAVDIEIQIGEDLIQTLPFGY